MTLLVAGASEVDAGKTTFSTGLVARTGAVGFKPRAGNDYWYDHDDYRRAITEGRLYGKDARRLAAASPGDLSPERLNPVHRLWQPTPGRSGPLGRADRSFLLDRAGDQFVVNATASLPASARRNLPLEAARTVDSLDALNRAMAELHLPATRVLGERIAATERAVVESYGDIARPLQDLDPDAVAVVEPTRARVYDGDRYRRACEVAGGSAAGGAGRLETVVADAVEPLEPAATVALPPLPADDRGDPEAVAGAYADAYDAVLDAAGW
jgi:predicted P-loop ATPase/GTPase